MCKTAVNILHLSTHLYSKRPSVYIQQFPASHSVTNHWPISISTSLHSELSGVMFVLHSELSGVMFVLHSDISGVMFVLNSDISGVMSVPCNGWKLLSVDL